MKARHYRKSCKSYPDGVLLIADNGGRTVDRYTVLYEPEDGRFPYTAMSEAPFHPQGFCQHGELSHRYSVWGRDERVLELSDLPVDCQKVVQQDLETS